MLKVKPIKVKGFDIPQVSGDGKLNLHFKLGVVGASGVGKTTAILNYLKGAGYLNPNIFTTRVLVSPSGCENEQTGIRAEMKYDGFATPGEEYSDCNKYTLSQILDKQTERILKHKMYLADKALWKKFLKVGIDGLTLNEQRYLVYDLNAEPPKPPFGHGHEHYPTCLIVFDDNCSNTSQTFISDFLSRSRHYNCSVVIVAQHFTQMSRGARKQLNGFMLFNTKDEALLTDLWKEQIAGDMKKEKWLNYFRDMDDRRDFLFVDYEAPDERRYRYKFEKFLLDWKIKSKDNNNK